jgi:hypothetical protein
LGRSKTATAGAIKGPIFKGMYERQALFKKTHHSVYYDLADLKCFDEKSPFCKKDGQFPNLGAYVANTPSCAGFHISKLADQAVKEAPSGLVLPVVPTIAPRVNPPRTNRNSVSAGTTAAPAATDATLAATAAAPTATAAAQAAIDAAAVAAATADAAWAEVIGIPDIVGVAVPSTSGTFVDRP